MLVPLHHLFELSSFQFDTETKENDFPDDLSPVAPRFFVPLLEDKPQNPILENLRLEAANSNFPDRRVKVKDRVGNEDALTAKEEEFLVEALWKESAETKLEFGIRNAVLSWDRLRPTHPTYASRTPFLSEQDEYIVSSARSHAQPRLFDPSHHITTTTERDFLTCLKSTVLGISSQLHTWDLNTEMFVKAGAEQDAKTRILVDGKDDVVSTSFLARFLTIGTLLRRLELLLNSLRTRSAKEGPTIHAFAHSLSTIVDYVRDRLVECPLSDADLETGSGRFGLSNIWSRYQLYEELLVALGDLYGRGESLLPHEYPHLHSSPIRLLSRIYEHLSLHFNRYSPLLIRSIMAFILSTTSHDYIQHVALSVGFGGQPKTELSQLTRARTTNTEFDDEEGHEEDIFGLLDSIETGFPSFFPQDMLDLLPAAQKSLLLLKIAQPEHQLLSSGSGSPIKADVRWLWTAKEVDAAWKGLPLSPESSPSCPPNGPAPPQPTPVTYEPELSAFCMFDLEPGVGVSRILRHLSFNPKDTTGISSSTPVLQKFISSFPPSLPPITPTLSTLSSLTFQPLMQHASTLSRTLLEIFVRQPGKLNFRTHLVLMKNFLLVAKPEFKTRLVAALFDDAGEFVTGGSSAHAMSVRAVRRRQREGYGMDVLEQSKRRRHQQGQEDDRNKLEDPESENQIPWAVGLAPHLFERETWPPGGADLSFFLRTVIVDSLDWRDNRSKDDETEGDDTVVLEEAEWRLGFAIKDLPVGKRGEKWLNPLSIEALDFLYMDYKPPKPLEVLISPDILSKYQRMFAFILRLLRLENALKSLFRMSTHRAHSTFLFPTLTKSRQLLLHFRFVAQSFTSSLSGYIFDTAIGGNFDIFLARLSSSTPLPSDISISGLDPTVGGDPDVHNISGFSDIFEVARCHSALLDDILSACLLRSGQRGVGDLLRQAMDIVLELTIVIGELHRGRMEEYKVAPMVEDLYRRFCVKMTMLTKVIKGLVEKGSSRSIPKSLLQAYIGNEHRTSGGLDVLHHLLLRLDLTDWWSSRKAEEFNK